MRAVGCMGSNADCLKKRREIGAREKLFVLYQFETFLR